MRNVTMMSRTELEQEKLANSREQSELNDVLIDLGYGHTPISQIPAEVPARIRLYSLGSRFGKLVDALEKIALGYRKSARGF